MKKAAMSPEERRLRRLAKPYYVEHGNNSWDHIQQVYTNADAMTRQIYGRPLTLSEKAAIFFHDSAVKSMGRKNHGQNARDLAVPILLSTGFFDQKQIDDIGQAILEHDTLDNKGGPFTSTTGEVLASADTEPPDIPWMLNKMYGWHIRNNPNKEDWKQGIYDSVKEYFGPDVNALQPPLYNKFHKDRRRIMKEQLNSYSADELWDIVTKYRKKHRIGEDEIRYPNTTMMKAASTLYHASPKALELLNGMTTRHGATGSVFVSPSKYHASLFALDRQGIINELERRIGKKHIKVNNFSYGQWRDAVSDKALDHADVYIDTDEQFETFSGEQKGYLYSVNDAPYRDKIKKWKHDNGERELLIEGAIKPDKKEELKLKYTVHPGRAPWIKDAAAISFPDEEIPTISKQDRIITTRVSDDYGKYNKGDTVETPWGGSYTVNDRMNLRDLSEHPYYDELTKDQKDLLKQYKRIAVLELLKNKYHRVTYGDTGVYQALKESLSPEDWKKFLRDASWLPKPKITYTDAYKSYFTDEGYKEFLDKTMPYIEKHLDKDKFNMAHTNLTGSPVYADKYQVVVKE